MLVVAIPAVHDGSLRDVLLAAVVLLVLGASEGLTPLPAAARTLRGCAVSAGRLQALEQLQPTVTDQADPLPLPGGTPALTLRDVHFRHAGAAPETLAGIDVDFVPGCRVALTGASGAGKTTLAELLVRFADPTSGSVALGGVDLRELTLDDVRRTVLLAQQDAHVFNTTIRENVLLANRAATEDELWAALETVMLADFVRALPQGLDTLVGEDGQTLSGGQRQRLTLARALIADARFLILDEPVAQLDGATAEQLMHALDEAAGDRGLIVITHRPEGLDRFDTVLHLQDGQIECVS